KFLFCHDNPVNLFDPLGLEVSVYSHIVFLGFPWSHANLRLYPDDTNNIPADLVSTTWLKDPKDGRLYIVLGAGNDDDFWTLTSHQNRAGDRADSHKPNRFAFLVDPPSGMSNDEFIVKLLEADSAYS